MNIEISECNNTSLQPILALALAQSTRLARVYNPAALALSDRQYSVCIAPSLLHITISGPSLPAGGIAVFAQRFLPLSEYVFSVRRYVALGTSDRPTRSGAHSEGRDMVRSQSRILSRLQNRYVVLLHCFRSTSFGCGLGHTSYPLAQFCLLIAIHHLSQLVSRTV